MGDFSVFRLKKTISFSNKRDLVYRTLKEHIVTGQIKPGQRFSASEVAEQLGVSRSPVNVAVRLLEEQGLIFVRPNKGFEIKTYGMEDISEVMRIRLELEKLAITWVIEKADEKELERLRELSGHMRETILKRDREEYYQASRDFHDAFYEMARAPACWIFIIVSGIMKAGIQSGWNCFRMICSCYVMTIRNFLML